MNLPFRVLAPLGFLALSVPLLAQQPFPPEEATRAARKLTAAVGNPSEAPFTTDVDAEKPHGFKVGEAGLLALPDRKLTTYAIDHAEKDIVPVGQLWTMNASLATEGKAIEKEKIRLVTITEGEKSRILQLYFLGASKNETGELQLSIFAADKAKPFLRVPLKHVSAKSETAPVELEGRKQDDQSGLLTIRVLGEYTAEVAVMKPQE